MMDEPAEEIPDFAGKVVAVGQTAGDKHSTFLGPVVEQRAGRPFLVGEPPHLQPQWAEGALVHIARESITTDLVWESLDAYKAQVARFPATADARPRRGWFGRRR